ncbi:MAG: TonB-dependent receptor [Bacteroidetes bacterium]|nr:TonB-dependent receptor [Bacteroidota bacterium]
MGKVFISAILLLSVLYGHSQTIQGLVSDSESEDALIGATIRVKGTSTGTTTDFDGNYTFQPGVTDGILECSYVGFKTIELPFSFVDGSLELTINIEMAEEGILLNETVVTASRYARKIGEETVSIEIIKSKQIGENNLQRPSDVLAKSPGVMVVDNQVNIRGGSGWAYGAGGRVLMLQDGMPIAQADAGSPSWDLVPLENIGQIEIIKGAASALYGSSAMNGIVNIKTAFAKSTPETYISLFSTCYGQPRDQFDTEGQPQATDWWNEESISFEGLTDTVELTKGIKPHPFSAGLSLAHRRRMGKKEQVDLTFGGFYFNEQRWRYGDPDHSGRINVHLRYRAKENMTIGLRTTARYAKSGNFFLWRGLGADKYLPNSLLGAPTETEIFSMSIDPYIETYDEKGNRHKVLARYMNIDNYNTNDQTQLSDYVYGEYQYQRSFSEIGLTFSGGATGSYTNVRAKLYGDQKLSAYNIGFYAQADKKFFDKLNMTLGLRLETNKQTSTPLETKPVVRFGMSYQAHKATYLRLSFGQAYRFPTIAEKFIETQLGSDIAIVPNLDLTSETGFSAEFGIKQGWQTSNKAFAGFIDVAVFYMRYFDMMEFNVDNDAEGDNLIVFKSKNVGNTFVTGVDLSVFATGKWRGHPTDLTLGYTYVDPKFQIFDLTTKNGGVAHYNVLKYRYRHTFTASWNIDLKGFTLGTSWQYFSFMENLDRVFNDESGVLGVRYNDWRELRRKDGRESNEAKRSYRGDFILDLSAGYHTRNQRFHVSVHVKNVANREYSLRPGLIEAPRHFSARMDISLK